MQLSIEGQFVEACPPWFDDDGQIILTKNGIVIAHPSNEPHVWNAKRQRWDKISWKPNRRMVEGEKPDEK